MLKVYLTVDVEIWPDDWDLSERRFPGYFDRYILGRTARGDYGLPFQLRLLREYGLQAVFFVEPFFAYQFGTPALKDIVAMVQCEGHAVELHAHTEWIGRTRRVIPPGRFQLNLRDYTLREQVDILRTGKQTLLDCGANHVTAFRAGNFGANRDTLSALTANGIHADSSYDLACKAGPFLNETLAQPTRIDGVVEYPMAVYRDALGRLRHAQVGASSLRELTATIAQAPQRRWSDFVLYWHSGELLNRRKTRPDPIAVRRFEGLCRFLALRRQDITTTCFQPHTVAVPRRTAGLQAGRVETLSRLASQSMRRLWGS